MSKIEKRIISGIIILVVLSVVITVKACNDLTEAGGIKQLIIEARKEVKDIHRQIEGGSE